MSRSPTELTRHITPTGNGHQYTSMVGSISRSLNRQEASSATAFTLQTLDLHLVTAVAVFLVHTEHDAWHVVPTDNRRENHMGSIVAGKSSLAHTTAVVSVLNGVLLLSFWSMVPGISGLSSIEGHSIRCIVTSQSISAHATARK